MALIPFFVQPCFGQYENEKDATIPLEYFYIKRKDNTLRKLLTKLNFSLSTGYGNFGFNHELDGLGILQKPDSLPKIFIAGQPASTYANWITTSTSSATPAAPGTFLVSSDTATIGFRSRSVHIPLKASVHVEFDRYRLGAGYSVEFMKIKDFEPITYSESISSFSMADPSVFMKRYFLTGGVSVYRYYDYLLVLTADIGGYNMGKTFDKSLISKGVYLNFGPIVERELSEYLRVFVRPSYELKNYKLSIPETGNQITHKLNGFYLNIGLTYRIPELPKCFHDHCKVQINHAHGNREYRSRVHPFYKKQNPHYGENYKVPFRYKGLNKRKLNPY